MRCIREGTELNSEEVKEQIEDWAESNGHDVRADVQHANDKIVHAIEEESGVQARAEDLEDGRTKVEAWVGKGAQRRKHSKTIIEGGNSSEVAKKITEELEEVLSEAEEDDHE